MGTRSLRPQNKVGAAAAASAAATLIWICLVTFVPAVRDAHLSDATVASLTGATATVIAFAVAYLVPNGQDAASEP